MRPPERSTWGNILRGGLDVAGGALFQVPTHLLRLGEDVAGFGGMILPGRDPLEMVSEGFESANKFYEENVKHYGPQGKAATAGALLAELGLTGLEYASGGAMLRGAAAASKLRGISRLGTRSSNIAGEAVKDALAVAPLDAMYASNPETSVTTLAAEMLPEGSTGQRAAEALNRTYAGRLVGEMTLGGTADILFRGAAGGLRGAKDIVTGQPVRSPLDSGFVGGESVNPEIAAAQMLEELESRPLELEDIDLAPIEPDTAVPVAEEPIPTRTPDDVQPPERKPKPKLGANLKPYAGVAARVGTGLLGGYGVVAQEDTSDAVSGLALAGAALAFPGSKSPLGRFGMRARAEDALGSAVGRMKEGKSTLPAKHWIKNFESLAYGEKEWTGIIEKLRGLKPNEELSVEQVSEYLADHGLRLREVSRSETAESRALIDSAVADEGMEAKEVIRRAKEGEYDDLLTHMGDDEIREAVDMVDINTISNENAIRLARDIQDLDPTIREKAPWAKGGPDDPDMPSVDLEEARRAEFFGWDDGGPLSDPLMDYDWNRIYDGKLRDAKMEHGLEYSPHDPNFSPLWTEGGDEYKEIKIILERKRPGRTEYGGTDRKEGALPDPSDTEPHTDMHWDEEDVLMHLRTHTRIEDGKKVLVVEEMQSDLHQEAQKTGYADPADEGFSPQELTAARKDLDDKLYAAGLSIPEASTFVTGRGKGLEKLRESLQSKLEALPPEVADEIKASWQAYEGIRSRATEKKEPWAPLGGGKAKRGKKDQAKKVESSEWVRLGWKRVIDEAVAQDVDRIAWTPGVQQAARNRHHTAQVADRLKITPYTADPSDTVKGRQRFIVSVLRGGKEEAMKKPLTTAEIKQHFGDAAAKRVHESVEANQGQTGWEVMVGMEELSASSPKGLSFYDVDMTGSIKGYLKKEFGIEIDPQRDLPLTKLNAKGERVPIQQATEKAGWDKKKPLSSEERKAKELRLEEAHSERIKLKASGGAIARAKALVLDVEISRLNASLTGRMRPQDYELRNNMWSFEMPAGLRAGGEAEQIVRSGGQTIMTPPPVVGGALGAAFGATQEAETDEQRGENILKGMVSGAMLGGGVSAMKGLRGRARSTKSMAAKRKRDPVIGDTDAEVVETLGPGSATAETIDNMSPSAAKAAAKESKKDSLLGSGVAGWWNRMRQGITRSVLAIEKLDVKAGRKDKPVTTAAGVARGFVTQAEPFIQEMLGSVVREHKPHLKLAAALAHADRWIEIDAVYGTGKVTTEQLERAIKTKAEIENLPADQRVAIKDAAKALTGYYRQLIDLKYKAGIYTKAQYDALTAKGASYVPFLPQELVEKSDEAFTSLADIYRLNASTGTRKMGDQINEALLVDPWEQAVRDTYETFRRIARQNLTNTVTELVRSDKALQKYVKIYDKKPPNVKSEELLTALGPDGKQLYYHVTDPDLLAAWSAIDINVGKIGLIHHANKMRKFMQSGVTLNPTFTARNGIRDFIMSAVQTRLNEGVPILGLAPPSAQVAGAATIGAATAEEGEEVTGALSGITLLGGTHLARHSMRVAGALNDILGPHNIGMAVGGISGYFSTTDESGFGDTIINMGTGAALGRTAGALGSVVGLRGSKTALRDFHKAGAGQFGFYSANVEDSKRMMQDMLDSGVDPADLIHPEGFGDAIRLIMQPISALLNLPKRGMKGMLVDSWVQPIKEFGKAVETAPRLAHFKRLRGKGVAADQAAFSARDLSLDFQIHGSFASTQVLIQTTPFLNPMLIGTDKLGRMMGDKDVWAPVAATMIAPSVLLWQLNHSDKEIAAEYESRPDWERNSFWLLPKKVMHKLGIEEETSGFYRVPKPFELGFVYASIPEQMLSAKAEYDDIGLALQLADWEGAVGDTMLDFMGSFVSPSLPMPIGGWVQTAIGEHGHSIYQDRPINPLPWMNIPQEQQETPYTSYVASMWHDIPIIGDLSTAVGISSPAKVDFIIRNYGGSMGAEAARALTAMARNYGIDQRPEAPKGQRYGFRDFQTNDQLVTQHETEFRDAYDTTEEAWNALQLGMKNDPTKVNLLLRDLDFRDNIARYQMGRDMKNTVDKLTSLRRQIRFGAGLDEDTKARISVELTGAIAGVSNVYKQARMKMDRRLREARKPARRRAS